MSSSQVFAISGLRDSLMERIEAAYDSRKNDSTKTGKKQLLRESKKSNRSVEEFGQRLYQNGLRMFAKKQAAVQNAILQYNLNSKYDENLTFQPKTNPDSQQLDRSSNERSRIGTHSLLYEIASEKQNKQRHSKVKVMFEEMQRLQFDRVHTNEL